LIIIIVEAKIDPLAPKERGRRGRGEGGRVGGTGWEAVDYNDWMLRIILTPNYWLGRLLARPGRAYFSQEVMEEAPRNAGKKPYEVLLGSSFELTPKIPVPYLQQTLRARALARLIAFNDKLQH
jgi:hypothetical protein